MWLLSSAVEAHSHTSSSNDGDNGTWGPVRLLPGSSMTAGRNRGHGIYLEGVQSVSRLHARLQCHRHLDTDQDGRPPVLSIEDLSKLGGVAVNGRRIAQQQAIDLHDGDTIRFSTHPLVLRVSWTPLRICTSRIDAKALSSSGTIGKAMAVVGADLCRRLSPDCTHLVVKNEPLVVTAKFACALILGVQIVSETWLTQVADSNRPQLAPISDHRPRRPDGSAACVELRYGHPSPDLFSSIAFVFFSTVQIGCFQDVITCAGGLALELQWRTPQHEVLDAGAVLADLRRLVRRHHDRRLALMQPPVVRRSHTAAIRAALTEAGVAANDESRVFAAILDMTIEAIRFVDPGRLRTAAPAAAARSSTVLATPALARVFSVVADVDERSTVAKTMSMALPAADSVRPGSGGQRLTASETANDLPPPVDVVDRPNPAVLSPGGDSLPPPPMMTTTTTTTVPVVVNESKPMRTIVAFSNGTTPVLRRLAKNVDTESSTAGNAVVIPFEMKLPPRPSAAPSTANVAGRNFKRFRKSGSFVQATSLTSTWAAPVVSVAHNQALVSMTSDTIERLQAEQQCDERHNRDLEDMFDQLAPSANTSRRRRR